MSALSGQTVLCVGGASGMGYGVAEVAASKGATVIVTSRTRERAVAAAEKLGPTAAGETVSLVSDESVAALFDRLERVDHMVVTAGAVGRSGFEEVPPADATAFMDGKLWGTHRLLWHGRTRLAERASICLITGGYAQWATAEAAHVHVAFAATEALARAAAVALAPIRCNVIRPGFVDTPMWDFMDEPEREELRRREAGATLIGRTVSPTDIGNVAVSLMSAEAVTGCVIPVDGGRHLLPQS